MKTLNALEIQQQVCDYLEQNAVNDIYINLCSCGALTIANYANSEAVQVKAENVPFLKATNDIIMCNCNHCCNNWGVDVEEEEEE